MPKNSSVVSRQSSDKNKRGFTLVELMVVISIIAILSAIGLTVYAQAQRSGRDAKRQADIHEIQNALEQYYALNRTYPGANGGSGSLTTVGTNFGSGSVPTGPKSGENYAYTPCTTTDQYTLCTAGSAMETCTAAGNKNCNATAAGTGCAAYTVAASGGTNTLFCVRSLSN